MNSLGGKVISLLVSHQQSEARIFTSFKLNVENIIIVYFQQRLKRLNEYKMTSKTVKPQGVKVSTERIQKFKLYTEN